MSERCDPLSRMTWLMCQRVLKHVLLMKAKRSTVEMKYFVKERKDPLLIMTWVMSQWWWTRRTWTSEFQKLPHSVVKHAKSTNVRESIQKIENHPHRHLFNKPYVQINHLILSVQNWSKLNKMWVTSNHVNCLRRNPKRSAKHAFHIGISALSLQVRAFLTQRHRGQSETRETYTIDLLSVHEYVIKKGRLHRKSQDTKTANQLKMKCKKREISKGPDRYEIKNSVFEWLKIIDEELCRRWMLLLRNTLTIWQHKNTTITRTNGGFIQISKVLIPMPLRHRSWFQASIVDFATITTRSRRRTTRAHLFF